MKNNKIKIFFFSLAFALLTKAGFVLAQSTQAESADELKTLAVNFFNWMLGAGILLSGGVFAFGAIYILIDYAKGKFLDEGKQWMKAGLLGLLLTLGSWVIINTINPDLLDFNVPFIKFGKLSSSKGGGPSAFDPLVLNYDEIPIGKLAENVLAKKISCYDFDAEGNPIAGDILLDKNGKEVKDKNGKAIRGPTYLEHDRADCYLKLTEAIEKKSLLAEQLSKEIKALMDKCKCDGKCKDTCNESKKNDKDSAGCKLSQGGFSCEGKCKNPSEAGCSLPDDLAKLGPDEISLSCCDADVKEKIKGYIGQQNDESYINDKDGNPIKKKHKDVEAFEMPIKKECATCNGGIVYKYYGLDEFYTNKNNISEKIEKKVKVDEEKGVKNSGKEIKYLDLDSCTTCSNVCQADFSSAQQPNFSVEPDWNDESFRVVPPVGAGECKPRNFSKINKKVNLVINSSIDKDAIDWVIKQFNDAAGKELFDEVQVDDATVNAYCKTDITGACVGGLPPPDNLTRVYDQKIESRPGLPWIPAGFCGWKANDAGITNCDIAIDRSNPQIKNSHDYRMVLLHEMGHCLGLSDMYDTKTGKATIACNQKTVMNSAWTMDGLSQADIDLIKNMYKDVDLGWINNKFLKNILSALTPSKVIAADNTNNKKDEDPLKCDQPAKDCLANRGKCIQKTDWGKLNLIEQLKYLNEKLDELKKEMEDDLNGLYDASFKLSKCAIAKSYIDLRQIEDPLNKNNTIIKIEKGKEDISTYCGGYNYQNSDCYQKCSDMCPLTEGTVKCYGTCASNNQCGKKPLDPDFAIKADYDKALVKYDKCIAEQNKCMNECHKNNTCKNTNEFSNFQDCTKACTKDCKTTCRQKYPTCSQDYTACEKLCDNNSKCVLDNLGSCLYNPQTISKCSSSNSDQENADYCIDNSYTCKYGSQQNSGYPECLLEPTKIASFSSSYLWKNPDKQLCVDSQATKKSLNRMSGKTLYYINKAGQMVTCGEANPENAKCPSSSSCPDCKCNNIEETFKFTQENKIEAILPLTCQEKEAIENGDPIDPKPDPNEVTCAPKEIKVKDFRLVGAECSQTLYNDDPLTFYCRQDWWNEPETKREDAVGNSFACSANKEIPVGSLVKDISYWGVGFKSRIEEMSKNLTHLVDNLDKLGKAKDYCQCDSKYETGMPVCMACCIYIRPKELIGGGKTSPMCNLLPCNGNSCQQMIDWLRENINLHTEIKNSYFDIFEEMVMELRTDILKKLTYSRSQINTCSASQNLNDNKKTKMLSCQNILDDIVPPFTESENKIIVNRKEIYHYCKGQTEGKVFVNNDTLDNWFCCDAAIPEVKK